MYVCMYVCMYILTVCSPVNSMNGSPSLNITGLCKLEMVVILKNKTKADSTIKERELYVHARQNYMYMPGRTICTWQGELYAHASENYMHMPGRTICTCQGELYVHAWENYMHMAGRSICTCQ